MLFNQTVMYALRAMNQLAVEYNECFVRSAKLAECTRVPPHYLSKVMRQLVMCELVVAQKGHRGGFRLARPPHEIHVVEVLEAMAVPIYALPCAFGWERCDSSNPCPLHWAWMDLTRSVREWAEKTTLDQVEHSPMPQDVARGLSAPSNSKAQ